MKGRAGCVVSDRIDENRTVVTAIPKHPEPEIGAFARSPNCAPGATDEREIQENDCVRNAKTDFNSVIGP
jgi:hypothetical protein